MRVDSHGSDVHRATCRRALAGIYRPARLAAGGDRLVDPADRGQGVCGIKDGEVGEL